MDLRRGKAAALRTMENPIRAAAGARPVSLLVRGPLWMARSGEVRFLLHEQKLPIDINEQVGGATPRDSALSMAALRGDLQMAELLLGYGADPDLVPWHRSTGQNAIELAARGGHVDVLGVLPGASKDEHSPARAFRAASRAARVRTLRWLMARWGDIAWRETSTGGGQVGRLALVYAIVDPAPDVVRFLVMEAGVPLNEGHEYVLQGRLPVAIAKTDGSRWIYELLLRLGAEDVEVDEEERALNDRWEGFESETGPVCGIRGVAVQIKDLAVGISSSAVYKTRFLRILFIKIKGRFSLI